MNLKRIPMVILMISLVGGCAFFDKSSRLPAEKFNRVFCWGRLVNDETVRKFNEIGVSDICVFNNKQLALALKYGMTPYCGTFMPRGKHPQVMNDAEEKRFAYINGIDLKGMPSKRRLAIMDKRRIETKHRYGGEPVAELDTLNSARIPCLLNKNNREFSKKTIDDICSRVKGVKGIFFDYIGYTNFSGCYCLDCLKAYKEYIAKHDLPDNQSSKDAFYLNVLVEYYNEMIDYVKSKHPDFKVVVHVYPTFLPEPLYGNRTKADFCGQTVAWYFPWDTKKITEYTKITIEDQKKYFKNAVGVPFVGLNRKTPSSLWVKSPATLEKELRTILDAGGDMLMVCNGNDMIKPGIYEVFKKYCGKDNSKSRAAKK